MKYQKVRLSIEVLFGATAVTYGRWSMDPDNTKNWFLAAIMCQVAIDSLAALEECEDRNMRSRTLADGLFGVFRCCEIR